MGLRFRRTVKIAPGLRVNFSKSGASWTLGPRGASIGVGRRGIYANLGIPGTGLYARERLLGGGTPRSPSRSRSVESVHYSLAVEDDGTLVFLDGEGVTLPEGQVRAIKRRDGDRIREFVRARCSEINGQIRVLEEVHRGTPDPRARPQHQVRVFDKPTPDPPVPKRVGFWARIFKTLRSKIEAENSESERMHQMDMAAWRSEKLAFDSAELARKDFLEHRILTDVGAMEQHLAEVMQQLEWPRETLLSTQVGSGGRDVFVDIDVPEIEDMPRRVAVVPQRGFRLSIKDLTERRRDRLYTRHVHGIGFRLIGEVFSALPASALVTVSAFTQRRDAGIGQVSDEYIYSVRVTREAWESLNFGALSDIDPVEALGRLDIRRCLSQGRLGAIEPFAPCETEERDAVGSPD
jgi:hypothetical protein